MMRSLAALLLLLVSAAHVDAADGAAFGEANARHDRVLVHIQARAPRTQ